MHFLCVPCFGCFSGGNLGFGRGGGEFPQEIAGNNTDK